VKTVLFASASAGSTSVVHDTEMSLDVGHCAEPGCYSKVINYNATIRQMAALAQLSTECHQSIKVNLALKSQWIMNKLCQFFSMTATTPLSNSTKLHMPGGMIEMETQNTFGPVVTQMPTPANVESITIASMLHWSATATRLRQHNWPTMVSLKDFTLVFLIFTATINNSGIITDKNVLPITRLNFGRTQLASSTGVHTLGRFQCSGQVAVTGMPKSCEDLWKLGHSLNGLYSIMGSKMVESVYCDFTKLPSDAGKENISTKVLQFLRMSRLN
jgi:hypothetical protein